LLIIYVLCILNREFSRPLGIDVELQIPFADGTPVVGGGQSVLVAEVVECCDALVDYGPGFGVPALAAGGGGEAEPGPRGGSGVACLPSGGGDHLPCSFGVVGAALEVLEAGHGLGELGGCLGAAENEAVSLGARFVTTWFTLVATYGSSEPGYDSDYFNHPGVAITAPDGNGAGYGTYYSAASPDVTAVGGTTLTADSATARGWAETFNDRL
jgi:hypothetical protein